MADSIISKAEMAALLGRQLSTVENTNYDLYLKIAKLRLEDLLCITIQTSTLPADLQLLLARCFGTIASEQEMFARLGVANKKVEDFSIQFEANTESPMVLFVEQNSSTIDKYSECQAQIRAGECQHDCVRCI